MRASKLIPLLLVLAIPAAVSGVGCGSSSPTTNGGNTGGDEDTGGKPATGGKSGTGGKAGTGGKSGDTGGSGGDTGGAGGSTGGAGGSTGGSSGDTGGAGGSTGGAMGSTGGAGGSTGGAGGSNAMACGLGKKAATGAVIENFDGMTQVLEWDQADKMHTAGTKITPTGSMKITVTGPETLAAGALAMWAMTNRPCLDASKYTGIQFNASGTVSTLLFRIGTPATYPVAEGGTCTSPTACEYAHWQRVVTANLGTAVIKVPFSELTAPFGTPAPFDKSALISLVFLTLDPDTTHSFTIDNISFY